MKNFLADNLWPELYLTERMKKLWEGFWVGPEKLPHGEDVLIAKLAKEGGDGYPVEVYVCAMPAMFFTIKVLPSPNSIGEERKGWKVSTGSFSGQLAKLLAVEINQGMLEFKGDADAGS